MTKETTDQLIQSNEEYVKLRNSRAPGEDRTPRETPQRRTTGNRGHELPEFDRWTTLELREYAEGLGWQPAKADHEGEPADPEAFRQHLLDFIESRDALRHRDD